MHDCQIQPPYCDPLKGGAVDPNTGNCGYKEVAPLLFVFVMLGINYMLLNLLIAVILDNFMETQSMSESKVTDDHLRSFDDAWSLYDHNADGFIECNVVPALITKVLYPLGLKNIPLQHIHGRTIRKHAKRMVQDLNCPVVKGMVAFASLRSAMNAHAMGDMELPEDASVVQDFKKLHAKKAGLGMVRKINRKTKVLRKKSAIGKPIKKKRASVKFGGGEKPTTSSASFEADLAIFEKFDSKNYTLGHVIAVVSTQALTRGIHVRRTLKKWRSVAKNLKINPKIHPSLRSRHILADNNFEHLQRGVESIKHRIKLGKLAQKARLQVAAKKAAGMLKKDTTSNFRFKQEEKVIETKE
jgi:hypothetical protein